MKKALLIFLGALLFMGAVGIGSYAYLTRPTKSASTLLSQNSPAGFDPALAPPMQDASPAMFSEPDLGAVPLNGGETLYKIDTASSTATFELDELLFGQPKHVVGTTSNVYGEIAANQNALSRAHLSVFMINARAFATDDRGRNNMIRRSILKTENDANEFIVFKTTDIAGLPDAATTSTTFPIQIIGDLSIAGVTKPATFQATAEFLSDGSLKGHAETTLTYGEYDIFIPNVPQIANVDKDVKLSIDFIANPTN